MKMNLLSDLSIIDYTCLDIFTLSNYEFESRYTLNISRKSSIATFNHLNLLESLNSSKTLIVMKRDFSLEDRIKQITLVDFEN